MSFEGQVNNVATDETGNDPVRLTPVPYMIPWKSDLSTSVATFLARIQTCGVMMKVLGNRLENLLLYMPHQANCISDAGLHEIYYTA